MFKSLLVSAVKAIKALFLIDQLSELKESLERIMACVMYLPMSCFKKESWKMYLMMVRAWILESSLSAV